MDRIVGRFGPWLVPLGWIAILVFAPPGVLAYLDRHGGRWPFRDREVSSGYFIACAIGGLAIVTAAFVSVRARDGARRPIFALVLWIFAALASMRFAYELVWATDHAGGADAKVYLENLVAPVGVLAAIVLTLGKRAARRGSAAA